MKLKKFLALGVATLAFSLPLISQASNNGINLNEHQINQIFSIQDNVKLIDNNFINQEKELEKNLKTTLLKAFNQNLVKYNELPTTVKLSFIKRFIDTEENSHYKEEENEIKIAYRNDLNESQFVAVNEVEAEIQKNKNFQAISYNKSLLNQFVFLHELAHSINHHQVNKSFNFNDPNTNLSLEEKMVFEKNTKTTFDENFADTYAAIMLLKLNNFSDDAHQIIDIVAQQRDFDSKKVDINVSSKPDSIDCHSSYYSLKNVLDNMAIIKSTNDTEQLKILAQHYASNGTALAYQKYTTYHTSSFEQGKLSQMNEFFLQSLYNKINEDKPGFIPIKKEAFELSTIDQKNLDDYLNKLITSNNNPLVKLFDVKNTETDEAKEVIEAAQKQQKIENNIIQYGYVRFMFNNYLKINPNYSLNIAKQIFINNDFSNIDGSIAYQLKMSQSLDAKLKVANESSISPMMSQTILAQNIFNTIATNNDKLSTAMNNLDNQEDYKLPDIKSKRKLANIEVNNDESLNTKQSFKR